MAQLSVKYFSQALNRNIRFEMYIPNDKPEDTPKKMRTLFLLHGYTGDAGNWVPERLRGNRTWRREQLLAGRAFHRA